MALRRILKERGNISQRLRLFEVPEISMDAKAYFDLINWQNQVTEPPILKKKP